MRHPDCHCPRAVHEHGQRITYIVHRCRCDDCRTANREAAQKRSRQKLYGRHWLTDAEPARAHIRTLMAAGMGLKTIAAAAGFAGQGEVIGIVYGKHWKDPDHPEYRPPRKQINRDTAARILALQPVLAPGAKVDARGTRRRVQALVARGYSLSVIAAAVGIERCNFYLHREDRAHCLEATRKAVADLYDQWWDKPPPSRTRQQRASVTRALNMAAANGWQPPAAWDDIDLDEQPPAVDKLDPRSVHPDDLRLMLRVHATTWEAAERLGLDRDYLLLLLKRRGIPLPAHIVAGDQDRRYTQTATSGAKRRVA